MFIHSVPMQFISIDIAYLPQDSKGYQYILLLGDTFSKCIVAIPLKDQTSPLIVDALLQHWIFVYVTTFYILGTMDRMLLDMLCEKDVLLYPQKNTPPPHTIVRVMVSPRGTSA